MSLELEIGLNSMLAYKRLPYTTWHALAEFIDNSTQNYLNFRTELDEAYSDEDDNLDISVVYDRKKDILVISDNAMGMSLDELTRALRVGLPPENPNGRSKYGLGMKTAACWLGKKWAIRTTRLGDPNEYVVDVDMGDIEQNKSDVNLQTKAVDENKHYTIITVSELYRTFYPRTLAKIKRRLSSMYRKDFQELNLDLRWQGELLRWTGFDGQLLKDKKNRPYRKDFEFEINGKKVVGWAGILFKGARSDAGFSILQNHRVIKGPPEAWRPYSIYGDARNDLINQRLVGEVHLDPFEVSHTKDAIQWQGSEEEDIEEKLAEELKELIGRARSWKKGESATTDGPNSSDVDKAASVLQEELSSEEMAKQLQFEDYIPDADMLKASLAQISNTVKSKDTPAISAELGKVSVTVYLAKDLSPMDPYVVLDSAVENEVAIVVNMVHPYVLTQIDGEESVRNYLRHCIYDAVAEAKGTAEPGTITPEMVKMLKDHLLRVPFEILDNEDGEDSLIDP